jgi:hypothetical protein
MLAAAMPCLYCGVMSKAIGDIRLALVRVIGAISPHIIQIGIFALVRITALFRINVPIGQIR